MSLDFHLYGTGFGQWRESYFLHVAGVAAGRRIGKQPVPLVFRRLWTRSNLARDKFALFDRGNSHCPFTATRSYAESSSVNGASLKRSRKRHAFYHLCVVGVSLYATSGEAIQIWNLRVYASHNRNKKIMRRQSCLFSFTSS